MKTDKKILKSASVAASAILTTAMISAPAMGMDILAYNDLGSGAEVRSHLIDVNTSQAEASDATTYKFGELKCGEDAKKGEKKGDAKAKSADDKSAEAKCGEGKCGEGKCGGDEKKSDAKADKSKEAKCGEGKCG